MVTVPTGNHYLAQWKESQALSPGCGYALPLVKIFELFEACEISENLKTPSPYTKCIIKLTVAIDTLCRTDHSLRQEKLHTSLSNFSPLQEGQCTLETPSGIPTTQITSLTRSLR